MEAIERLQEGKAPGVDGYSSAFYKLFKLELLDPLHALYNSIEKEGTPHTWQLARISVIPKPGKDDTKLSNYRPISLLNVDYKIYMDILANRFKNILNDVIGKDQNGFLPERHLRYNIRSIVNSLHYYHIHKEKKFALITVDMEKAFDSLRWDFLLKVLKEMNIGERFINIIQQIYTRQRAFIWINDQKTQEFEIKRGVRQGCPLSPLLFISAIEILMLAINHNDKLIGIKSKGKHLKAKAFADDVAILLEDPLANIDSLQQELNQFGKIAGLKINKNKTVMITKNLNNEEKRKLVEKSGFKIEKQIRYLGVILTNDNRQLFDNNYKIVWKEIKEKLTRWNNLNLSILGRIAVTKMMVLPKLMFLFLNLPIEIKYKKIMEWERDLKQYVWKGSKPRIKWNNLKDSKNNGGQALPDLKSYYWSCSLMWIQSWIKLDKHESIDFEDTQLNYGWHAYLCYNKSVNDKAFYNHPFRKPLLMVWNKIKDLFYFKIPIWTSSQEAFFSNWQTKENNSWLSYKDLLVKNQQGNMDLKTRERLFKEGYNLHWFSYL